MRKPERLRGDEVHLCDVYLCDEMDPYIEQLEKRLATVRALGAKARAALDHPDNHCTIVDTIWVGPAETLGDLLEDIAGSEGWPDPKAKTPPDELSDETRALRADAEHTPEAIDAAQRVADRRAAAEGETRIDGDAICTVCGHFFRAHNGDQCFGNLGCYCSVFSAPAEDVTDGE